MTPWTAARQASLSVTDSWSLLKLISIESVMPANHLFLCHPHILLPSVFPSIRVFSNESALRIRWPKYWSFCFSISPSNEYSGLISFRMDWLGHVLAVWVQTSSVVTLCFSFLVCQMKIVTVPHSGSLWRWKNPGRTDVCQLCSSGESYVLWFTYSCLVSITGLWVPERNGLGLTALLSSHSLGNRDVWDSPHQQVNPLRVWGSGTLASNGEFYVMGWAIRIRLFLKIP